MIRKTKSRILAQKKDLKNRKKLAMPRKKRKCKLTKSQNPQSLSVLSGKGKQHREQERKTLGRQEEGCADKLVEV
jgi:hypothetical protein